MFISKLSGHHVQVSCEFQQGLTADCVSSVSLNGMTCKMHDKTIEKTITKQRIDDHGILLPLP